MATAAKFDAADYLRDDKTVAEYITAAREDHDPDMFLAALRDVARNTKYWSRILVKN